MREHLADLILIVHFALAAYITLGLIAIYAGLALHWPWTRAFWFRLTHLGAIVFVALQALAGVACPLTVWEDALRGVTGAQPGFIARWVRRLLFYNASEAVFAAIYVAAALATALAWVLAPPRRSERRE